MELRSSAGNQAQSRSQLMVELSTPETPSPRKRTRTFNSRTTTPKTPTLASPTKAKKIKLQASYATQSPFPNHAHPTADEAVEIHDILTKAHQPVSRRPPDHMSNSAQNCGNVPNVIEAIIGTILSQNTSNAICAKAKSNLDKTFGRNNFEAIAAAPKQKVIDAIRSGGLANKKARMIQGLLQAVKEKHGSYSLQHLARKPESTSSAPALRDDEIMDELLSYDGVGPKTASCVLLFCIGRDSFPVDTHVLRLSHLLGWIPPEANRVTAQAHLDIRVPAELKYGLHMLMFQHGRECKGCKQAGSEESCVLKSYLKERKKVGDDDISHKVEEADLKIKMEEKLQ